MAPASFVYSGIATAVAAGDRHLEEASIDVGALAGRRGVHHHVTRVRAVDPTQRRLTLEDGADLAYDVASLNLGSVVGTDRMEVSAEVATVKPFDRLLGMARWLAQLPAGAGARVSIVGGGPTGLELAGQFSHRFGDRLEVTVLERGPTPGARAGRQPAGAGRGPSAAELPPARPGPADP